MANKACSCAACNERFNSIRSFECHRVAHRCRSVPQMLSIGMVRNHRGLWVSHAYVKFHDTIEQTSGYVAQFDHWPRGHL